MNKNILNLRNVLLAIAFSAFFYLALMFYLNGLRTFLLNAEILILILFFLFLAMIFKGLRWIYLLKKVCKKEINYNKSLLIHFSSFSFIITPGKAGDVLKSWMMKKSCGTSHSEVLPVILMERLTDIISLFLLSLLWFLKYMRTIYFLFVVSSILLGFIIFTNDNVLNFLSNRFLKTKTALINLKNLSKPNIIFVSSFLDTIAWIFDAFIFLIILKINNINLNFFVAVSLYTFSILLGALSFIPGGLGSTEIVMGAILKEYLKINNKLIVKIVLETRFYTLWCSIFVGLVFLIIYKKFNI